MVKNILHAMGEDGQIRRVWDREECKALAYRHAHYMSSNLREKELDELWVKEPENQKTASFGRNWGYHTGMEAVRKCYLENNSVGDGGMVLHPVSTDLLHVANDGKTAQGMWYSMGHMTVQDAAATTAEWLFERVCMDFIKEADGWRIWHMFIGTDISLEAGTEYNAQPVLTESGSSLPEGCLPEREFMKTAPKYAMKAYTSEFNWYQYPPLPEPYESFADVVSCGPEGNPAYGKEA